MPLRSQEDEFGSRKIDPDSKNTGLYYEVNRLQITVQYKLIFHHMYIRSYEELL